LAAPGVASASGSRKRHSTDPRRPNPQATDHVRVSAPYARRYPQVGFSLAIRSTRWRISSTTPGRPRRCGQVQRRRTKSRCHRSSVAGCTNRPCHTQRGSSRESPASTARSAQSNRGRATRRRSTATSCRNTSRSASLVAERRASSTSHPSSLQKIRYISRRVIYRSSRPGDCPGELPAQHPRPTFWHPQVYRAAITGIHTDAAGDDRRNLNGEYALVRNTGAAAINLAGWKLSAGDRGQRFSLARYPLKKNATVTPRCGSTPAAGPPEPATCSSDTVGRSGTTTATAPPSSTPTTSL